MDDEGKSGSKEKSGSEESTEIEMEDLTNTSGDG